ncbi:hypothetical protein L484_023453 [Morus notabilis]|uniref:Uncharacterized protein n=1 Tax=Morus notabilis TaxID=981085 RepID=W9S2D3_9ROSA|nr:hypothetical protein L484_023453 [Morus notabilis]
MSLITKSTNKSILNPKPKDLKEELEVNFLAFNNNDKGSDGARGCGALGQWGLPLGGHWCNEGRREGADTGCVGRASKGCFPLIFL